MAINSLPEELISEILSPVLHVPDENLFADIEEISRFAEYLPESPSEYLPVCKTWMRVATPLLYDVVVIRSKAQAHALKQALLKNKDLGLFIKRLRVEGGYGAPMRTILQSSPHISDLVISLNVFSSDSASGLCAGLPLVNPKRLIFQEFRDFQLPKNPLTEQGVKEAMLQSASKWNRLFVLKLPCFFDHFEMLQAFNEIRTLHTLSVASLSTASRLFSIFKDCPLQCIEVTYRVPDDLERVGNKDPTFRALLRFADPDSSDIPGGVAHSSRPLYLDFIPMEAATPEIKEIIWKRVLYFALSVPELEEDLYNDIPPRLPILLVSKYFNRLALRYYYTHICLKDHNHVPKLVAVLERNPWLGCHIRRVLGYFGEYDNDGRYEYCFMNGSLTTGLEELLFGDAYEPGDKSYICRRHISWRAFEIAMETCGSTLQKLTTRLCTASLPVSPAIFSRFTALRSLIWECGTEFDLDEIPSAALPCLTELSVAESDSSFLVALTRMKLPSLRTLALCYHESFPDFLRSHGTKLVDVTCWCDSFPLEHIFELCPSIKILGLYLPHSSFSRMRVDPGPFISENLISSTLEKIVLGPSFLVA
ncbi:hypothetical protein FB45DRAFT_1119335 [Roridomyces roridus]|uniref:F-box domain-containing protein n=1 Tax=Roridomyces roridus TaxID=1738132 RepID=A0AAD7B680_9AGAR|nr:hypothetical protein FB45DRAFT_1119335 [Roridomyces roridus]